MPSSALGTIKPWNEVDCAGVPSKQLPLNWPVAALINRLKDFGLVASGAGRTALWLRVKGIVAGLVRPPTVKTSTPFGVRTGAPNNRWPEAGAR